MTYSSSNKFEEISDSESDPELSHNSLESLSDSDSKNHDDDNSGSDESSSDNDPTNDEFYNNNDKEDEQSTKKSVSFDLVNSDKFNKTKYVPNSYPMYSPNGFKRENNNLFSSYGSKYLSEYLDYHPDKARQISLIFDPISKKRKLQEIFPENDLRTRLTNLETTQVSIEGFANSVTQYSYPPGPILQLFLDVFVSLPVNASTVRLAIFYVYNHLIQTFTNENIWKYPVSFHYTGVEVFCIPAIIHTNKIKCNNIIHICNCINIWRQRCIYTKEVCDRLENITTNTSIIKNSGPIKHNFNINDELGYLNVLYHIFKMPLVDGAYDKATTNCDVEKLKNSDFSEDKEFLDNMVNFNKEEEFAHAGRLSGQELIILNSACLDLGAMIKENDENFKILGREINKLDALLNRK